jgi:hypothetical protein
MSAVLKCRHADLTIKPDETVAVPPLDPLQNGLKVIQFA